MKIFLAACIACAPAAAFAASLDFDVSAQTHSYSGGAGLGFETGISFKAGDAFQISADTEDFWAVGDTLSRVGNADGLSNFQNYVSGGLDAMFGTLVGRIGSGDLFVIGTDFDGNAANAGLLSLFAWDSNFEDNSGEIRVTVTTHDGPDGVVPLPASLPLMLAAMGLMGLAKRKFS